MNNKQGYELIKEINHKRVSWPTKNPRSLKKLLTSSKSNLENTLGVDVERVKNSLIVTVLIKELVFPRSSKKSKKPGPWLGADVNKARTLHIVTVHTLEFDRKLTYLTVFRIFDASIPS